MNKKIALLILVLVGYSTGPATAQWTDNGGSITTTDKVGIGTSSPKMKFQVDGNTLMRGSLVFNSSSSSSYLTTGEITTSNAYRNFLGPILLNGSNSYIGNYGTLYSYQSVFGNYNGQGYAPYVQGDYAKPIFEFISGNYGDHDARLNSNTAIRNGYLYQFNRGTESYTGDGAAVKLTSSNTKLLWGITASDEFYFNGNIGIGVSNPTEKLTVAGTAKAEEVIVEENVGADFVFEENYNLPTLSEVEQHIKSHKHLPEIPSAKEMKRNGVKVGELQIKLLQKIEELTLYVIELEKRDRQKAVQIQKLKKMLSQGGN